MTSTYDHRVIQGAESGAFLRRSTSCSRARTASTRASSAALGVALPALPRAPDAAARRRRTGRARRRRRAERGAAAGACRRPTSLVKAHRMHGHLAARLDPLGSEPVGDPALEPEPVG